MTNQKQKLHDMIVLATNRHANQFDKGGNPYILHCFAVMYLVESEDYEVKQIAVGHDLVEDTDVTWEDLIREGFSDRVIQGIMALTKQRGETYEQYKNKVKSNKDAVLVKMADLRHNSDITRLKGVAEKDIARIAKYMQFYSELKALKV
jgi:(p)ppGpp synthase/HD superfamily hydrolase